MPDNAPGTRPRASERKWNDTVQNQSLLRPKTLGGITRRRVSQTDGTNDGANSQPGSDCIWSGPVPGGSKSEARPKGHRSWNNRAVVPDDLTTASPTNHERGPSADSSPGDADHHDCRSGI
jgi:hypothetical protein